MKKLLIYFSLSFLLALALPAVHHYSLPSVPDNFRLIFENYVATAQAAEQIGSRLAQHGGSYEANKELFLENIRELLMLHDEISNHELAQIRFRNGRHLAGQVLESTEKLGNSITKMASETPELDVWTDVKNIINGHDFSLTACRF